MSVLSPATWAKQPVQVQMGTKGVILEKPE